MLEIERSEKEKLIDMLLTMIKAEYKIYRSGCRQGVVQGFLIRDPITDEVINRAGRQSLNPEWYRRFYDELGYAPTDRQILKRVLMFMRHGDDSPEVNSKPFKAFKNFELRLLAKDRPIEDYITAEVLKEWTIKAK